MNIRYISVRCSRRRPSPLAHPQVGSGDHVSRQGSSGRAWRSLPAGDEGCPLWQGSIPRLRLDGGFQGTIAQQEIPLQTVLAQEKSGQETNSKARFIAAGLRHQPPAQPQPGRGAAPWVDSACWALLEFDFSWEFLRGTRLSWDRYFYMQVIIWFKSKLANMVIAARHLPGRQPAADQGCKWSGCTL